MISNVISLPVHRQAPDRSGCLFCASEAALVPFKDTFVCERCCDEVAAVLLAEQWNESNSSDQA